MDKLTVDRANEAHENLKAELESLRQENSRLRERMNQLTDDYEGTIKKLREALDELCYVCTCKRPASLDDNGTITIPGPHTKDCVRSKALLALNPPKNR